MELIGHLSILPKNFLTQNFYLFIIIIYLITYPPPSCIDFSNINLVDLMADLEALEAVGPSLACNVPSITTLSLTSD